MLLDPRLFLEVEYLTLFGNSLIIFLSNSSTVLSQMSMSHLSLKLNSNNEIEKVKRDYPDYFQQPEGELIENQNNQSTNSKRSTDDATE